MGALETQIVEDRHDVGDPQTDRIRVRFVRLIASTVSDVVDEDQPEIWGVVTERPRDRRFADQLDRVEEAAVDQHGRPVAAVVLVMDPSRGQGVDGVRHSILPHGRLAEA